MAKKEKKKKDKQQKKRQKLFAMIPNKEWKRSDPRDSLDPRRSQPV